MDEQEKVIKGLESCSDPTGCDENCPYYKDYLYKIDKCTTDLAKDTLKLIKDQKRRIKQLREMLGIFISED